MGLAYIKQFSVSSLLGLWLLEETLEELTNAWNFTKNQLLDFESRTTEKRKKEWLACRLLLKLLLDNEQEISYSPEGKPLLTNGLSISISHSEDYIAILIDSKKNAGVDIQKIKPKLIKGKDYFLQPSEIKELTNPDDEVKLTLYWAAKEAIFKYIGLATTNLKDDVTIKPFHLAGEGLVYAIATKPSSTEEIVLRYTHFDDYIMVFTT